MIHAPTPWGFSPLTGVQTSNMNISQTVKNYMVCHISTKTSRQVETIKSISDREYINLVGKNSHSILVQPLVLLGLTSMTTTDQHFLGLASYYIIFIKDFSKMASPIFSLLAKYYELTWSNPCQDAFELIKGKLTTAPIL